MRTDDERLEAWLLPISKDMTVAVGRYELKYIEYPQTMVALPGLPAYCEQGFVWREHFVPVIDLHGLISRRRPPITEGDDMVAVIAYEQGADSRLAVGAITLRGVPQPVAVDAMQAIPASELEGVWPLLSLAAFRQHEQVYPVLDLCQLFDTTPKELLHLN